MDELEYFKGDIVIATNGNATKHIQGGTRPYLIVSNNQCNQYSDIATAIPLTTKEKNNLPTHYSLFINGRRNTILAEQITCISRSNIVEYVYTLDDNDLNEVEKRIKIQLGLKGE